MNIIKNINKNIWKYLIIFVLLLVINDKSTREKLQNENN